MDGSGVMTIFVYKGLTRNLEMGNTPVRVLSKQNGLEVNAFFLFLASKIDIWKTLISWT